MSISSLIFNRFFEVLRNVILMVFVRGFFDVGKAKESFGHGQSGDEDATTLTYFDNARRDPIKFILSF